MSLKRVYELADFEGGCQCMVCFRPILEGQPYAWNPSFVDEDSTIYGDVVCVYCEFVEELDGAARTGSDCRKTD